jgi:hypothetical protein
MHDWPLDKAIKFHDWIKVCDFYRAQILERQASGYYEKDHPEETKKC